ncbi:MAG: phosphatase PAP2 family protein [Calditrichae bacterium]|nr:phosphatase PAP2 family protein [Calditrichia bacterium]
MRINRNKNNSAGNNLNNKYLQPLSKLAATYQFIMLLLNMVFFYEIDNAVNWLFINLIIFAFLIISRFDIIRRMKAWSLLVIIPVNFTQLHYMVHTVHPSDFDIFLIKFDYMLFGSHPTLWMEAFTKPLITEILQIVYSTFYFLPIVLGLILFLSKRLAEFDFFIFQVVYGFYLSYLGYFIIPAIGPRFTLDHLQTFQLSGVWIMETIHHLLNQLENIQRDAFPSGHTAITVLTLFYAKKYNNRYFYFMLPITLMMILSTVYLRYHYVIDVIAGLFLFMIIITTGPFLYKKLKKT